MAGGLGHRSCSSTTEDPRPISDPIFQAPHGTGSRRPLRGKPMSASASLDMRRSRRTDSGTATDGGTRAARAEPRYTGMNRAPVRRPSSRPSGRPLCPRGMMHLVGPLQQPFPATVTPLPRLGTRAVPTGRRPVRTSPPSVPASEYARISFASTAGGQPHGPTTLR